MQNILILANGEMSKHFVQWVGKSRIDMNRYYITCAEDKHESFSLFHNLNFIDIDPTSFLRIKELMEERVFSTIFIVMKERSEALYTLKNIRMLDLSIFVVFVSKWDNLEIDDDNMSILNVNEILASNLYEKLPNVPLIAKNIGLGKGEIMEVLIPFGSSFAYRHVGAISHRKWRVAAIYRKEKQILPNNATMILPNDRLIVMGSPLVLEEVFKRVNRRQGVFPEPFGKNLYLIVDMQQKKEDILIQINEAIYLSNQLVKTKLFIRLVQITTLESIREIRTLENNNIFIFVSYEDEKILGDIDCDVSRYDIGLFLMERSLFFRPKLMKHIVLLKRAVYLFGESALYNIKESVLLMGDEMEMESLSTSVFDFSESLGLKLSLCNYNPEGDFEESSNIHEHYESMSRLYNFKINIKIKRVNPIRELVGDEKIIHIAPLNKEFESKNYINIFSQKVSNYFMAIKKHPQLLIPVEG